ncbi:hypothetical protein BFJ69_g16957 [Fusarium oxysporum]|uniref:Uncharacterized protein n=1 Tax=Fusarium oxysporum TaxID=5507 RepID=A0A420M9M8_FUSOX|nr:hypothetical protein BFJ69_g16957 [Fusarium oxysporum]
MHFHNIFIVLAAITGAYAACSGTSTSTETCTKQCFCSCPAQTVNYDNAAQGCSSSGPNQGIVCPAASGPTPVGAPVPCASPCPSCDNCPLGTPSCRDPNSQSCANALSRCNGAVCTC